jgi:hypothetical protein
MKKKLLLLVLTVMSLSTSATDIVVLVNNMTFEGKVTKIKKCMVFFDMGSEQYEIPATDIFSIQFENVDDKVYRDYMKLSENDPEVCLQGRKDAHAFHGKKGGHFFLGLLFGPLAVIGTALANPTPDKGRDTYREVQNRNLLTDPIYIKCYKKRAKGQLIGAEFFGWGTWVVILLLTTA